MFNKTFAGASAALLLLPAMALAAAAPVGDSLAQQIDASIAPLYKPDAPGATVIVVKDGKTVFRKAYGMADVARHVALTPETTMRLGSVTKQFTSTAILMLADEGKLSVSDDITTYLPDFPTHGKKITIEHLLTHTSGVANYTSKPDFVTNNAKDVTLRELIDSFKNDPFDFEPGSAYRYSNSGYILLGAIIEKVSGVPYPKFVEQKIFVPLGMNNTAYEGNERTPNPHAVGYDPAKDGFVPAPPISMTQPYAAGALVSTVDDLARWDAAVSSGRLLKAASWQRAFTEFRPASGKPTSYGYGWEIENLRGVPKIAHAGSVNGFLSYVMRLPTEHVYVAVLSNARGGLVKPDIPAEKAAAIVIGKPFPEFKAIKVDAAQLDQYTGVYKGTSGAVRTVRKDGDTLVIQRTGGPRVPLKAYAANGFYTEGLQWFDFERDTKGNVKLAIHTAENDFIDERVGPVVERQAVKIADAAFDARAGTYAFPREFTLILSREGDRYFAQGKGQPKLEIFPESETVFFAKVIDAELRFENASDPAQLVLMQGANRVTGNKLP
jgi:CubicO group peptidase (beta-lactamase class C family)